MLRRKFVVSAINISEGGPLTALKDFLAALSACLDDSWDIVALVHRRDLFEDKRITYLEYPSSKSSWFLRLYFEWCFFKKISKSLNPDIWFSFHDISPNVIAKKRIVYCHNPAPFYKITLKDIFFEPKLLFFNKLYSLVYRVNLNKNAYIVVQQHWLRKEFLERFRATNVLVAHPVNLSMEVKKSKQLTKHFTFFYPVLPRVFKNVEVICRAVELLVKEGCKDFQVLLTIDGSENRYAKYLVNKYACLEQINFLGRLSHSEIMRKYHEVDCLMFPSRLETWGLPLSEAKQFNLPILAADLPYAHEAVGAYLKARFFPPNNEKILADLMKDASNARLAFDAIVVGEQKKPDASSWADLIQLIFS